LLFEYRIDKWVEVIGGIPEGLTEREQEAWDIIAPILETLGYLNGEISLTIVYDGYGGTTLSIWSNTDPWNYIWDNLQWNDDGTFESPFPFDEPIKVSELPTIRYTSISFDPDDLLDEQGELYDPAALRAPFAMSVLDNLLNAAFDEYIIITVFDILGSDGELIWSRPNIDYYDRTADPDGFLIKYFEEFYPEMTEFLLAVLSGEIDFYFEADDIDMAEFVAAYIILDNIVMELQIALLAYLSGGEIPEDFARLYFGMAFVIDIDEEKIEFFGKFDEIKAAVEILDMLQNK
jgi:hypothetical protein